MYKYCTRSLHTVLVRYVQVLYIQYCTRSYYTVLGRYLVVTEYSICTVYCAYCTRPSNTVLGRVMAGFPYCTVETIVRARIRLLRIERHPRCARQIEQCPSCLNVRRRLSHQVLVNQGRNQACQLFSGSPTKPRELSFLRWPWRPTERW